jgi:putative DNA-invertase from lambdoid prophage Rac
MGGLVLHDGISKFIFTLLSAFADFERNRIALRIREAKQHQKQRGDYLGGPAPFGWRVIDGRYVPGPEKQAAVAEIFALRSRSISYQRIANALRERSIHISHMTVKHVLARPQPRGEIGFVIALESCDGSRYHRPHG